MRSSDNKNMKYILIFVLLQSLTGWASVIGISTHPLNEEARVLSAEMTGYMSQRQEMGMGLRYTQEVSDNQLFDVSASGGQNSRALIVGGGMDFKLLSEDVYQPRVSIKPYFQHQKFEDTKSSLIGAAPTLRKGFSANGYEFFPYLAVPTGMKLSNDNDSFVYYAALTFGASMPFPGAGTDKFLLSLEGNRDLGGSSDYLGCLVSWVWN